MVLLMTLVAISDKNKTQDVNHNNVHDFTHHSSISHTTIDQLSVCERQMLEALSSLNSQPTHARICAQ